MSSKINVRIPDDSYYIRVILSAAIQQYVPHSLVRFLYYLALNFISGFTLGEFIGVGFSESRLSSMADSLLISCATVSMGRIYIPIIIVVLPLRGHLPVH
jgi:hypothetical protein